MKDLYRYRTKAIGIAKAALLTALAVPADLRLCTGLHVASPFLVQCASDDCPVDATSARRRSSETPSVRATDALVKQTKRREAFQQRVV
jgi:hypothetical protein